MQHRRIVSSKQYFGYLRNIFSHLLVVAWKTARIQAALNTSDAALPSILSVIGPAIPAVRGLQIAVQGESGSSGSMPSPRSSLSTESLPEAGNSRGDEDKAAFGSYCFLQSESQIVWLFPQFYGYVKVGVAWRVDG